MYLAIILRFLYNHNIYNCAYLNQYLKGWDVQMLLKLTEGMTWIWRYLLSEYKFVTLYLTGELTFDEMRTQLATAIHQFAKRQMTWFRGMERKGIRIHWTTV